MVKIHGPEGGPNPVLPSPDGTQWAPYMDNDDLKTLRNALAVLKDSIAGTATCNKYFNDLGNSITFDKVFADPDVWISFDPTGPAYGAQKGKQITIAKLTLSKGPRFTAATLVHEMAHVAGASDAGNEAQKSVLHCGLKDLYEDPPEPKEPPDPSGARSVLPGNWKVTIGNWNGLFVFSRNGVATWRETNLTAVHMGTWKVVGDEVQWSYNDDQPGWQRIWHIKLPISSGKAVAPGIDGNVTINGVPHGFFRMSKYEF